MYLTKDFLSTSPTRAVQHAREILSEAADPIADADNVVFDLTGTHSPYTDSDEAAIMYAQYVIEGHIKKRFDVTGYAKERVEFHKINSPKLFTPVQRSSYSTGPVKIVKIENVSVAVKDNGKIKKGGKQLIAEQMYKSMVVEGGMSNADFVKQLQEKVSMSLYGARTYAHNMKKKFGASK